ncbi:MULTISPECIES: sensor histidine kinase [unclassified Blautia]|uniref:sensor histidine kinase n=1 Tax=unclassified Blautia TaxID=2648079 RepID=UPI000B38129F|nr:MULTISPECIES: HAMP domain-containing sensor histidine kinase [unclassified Blautia]OUN31166.1 hypothetical protein B5G33_03550 [Blautia sp. An81]OUN92717.1 hypothetical protein B5G00_08130 [Blautia sp. An46]
MFQLQNRKEMEALSEALEKLINGEEPETAGISQDTLPSKVRSQILRLGEIMKAKDQALGKEKEEIRGLIADTAHQLRTPLANMESYLELLETMDWEEKERENYLLALRESQEKIRFLTEGLIKMARLESRIIQIRKEARDLQETLLESILQVKKEAEEKHIEIRLEMTEGEQAPHDRQWLGEAVYNLLDNSVKYSEEYGQILMTVVRNEMFTEIRVCDWGRGIEEGEENLVFGRFYRGKNVSGEKGFGLGLYLAREIVHQHGGFLRLKRQEPGLSVSIYLPEE